MQIAPNEVRAAIMRVRCELFGEQLSGLGVGRMGQIARRRVYRGREGYIIIGLRGIYSKPEHAAAVLLHLSTRGS